MLFSAPISQAACNLNPTSANDSNNCELVADFNATNNASKTNNSLETFDESSEEIQNPFISPWPLQVFYYIFFVTMVAVAAGGNLIVIWLVVAHKRMRTVTNYFLVNLAVADALISVANTLLNFVYLIYNDWFYGKTYCRFALFIAPCTISASVFTFMAIAFDRYMAIVHPLKPRLQARTVMYVIAVIWLASVVIAFPMILYGDTFTWKLSEGRTRTICLPIWPDGQGPSSPAEFAYSVFQIAVNYVVPLAALAATYAIVGRKLWGSETIGERTPSQTETVRSKRKVVKMMIVVVVIFAVCWLPFHAYFIISYVHKEINSFKYIQPIYLIIYWIAMSNSMYNPIMYCWMNARFRNGFKYVFRYLPCVTWQSDDRLGLGRTKMIRVCGSNSGGLYRLHDDLQRRREESCVRMTVATRILDAEGPSAAAAAAAGGHPTAAYPHPTDPQTNRFKNDFKKISFS